MDGLSISEPSNFVIISTDGSPVVPNSSSSQNVSAFKFNLVRNSIVSASTLVPSVLRLQLCGQIDSVRYRPELADAFK